MGKRISEKSIKKNLTISVFAQAISLSVSFVIGFIVPKCISEHQYAYWQTFVLYVGYVGILHFGLLDGIVLRYSEFDYDELDKEVINSQFRIMCMWLIINAFVIYGVSFSVLDKNQTIVIRLVAIGIMTKNIFAFMSFVLQITNRIKKYAVIVITQRVIYVLAVLGLLFFHVNNFVYYALAELLGDIVASIIGMSYNLEIIKSKTIVFKGAVREVITNIKSGIILMTANWASMLFVGMAKMIIQWRWDVLTFGKVSFAFSVANLFLGFVSAMSVVLFPTLKRVEKDQLPTLYYKIRRMLSALLFTAMLAYFPGSILLKIWLPKYSVSLEYLGILLPIIIYMSKVSMLTNNYLKAYRREKELLIINIVSIFIGVASYLFAAYVCNSLTMMLATVVGAMMLRSILSEIEVMHIIHKTFVKDFIIEIFMTIGFILVAGKLTALVGGFVYGCIIIVYTFYNNAILQEIRHFMKIRKNRLE